MNLFTILNANNYFSINREVARTIGLIETILLSELVDKFTHFESKGQLNDGWFYLTIEVVEERTTLTRRQQDTAIAGLKKLGFIDSKQMGMPAKRHFKIFKEKITEWLIRTNKIDENAKQGCTKTPNMNEQNVQPTPIYKETEEEPKEQIHKPPAPKGEMYVPHGSFVKLKEEEYKALNDEHTQPVIDELISQINDYLASTGRKAYKDYAATIRNWLRRAKDRPSPAKATKPSDPNTELNLEAFRGIVAASAKTGQKPQISLRGAYVYHITGDSVALSLQHESFVEIICKWTGMVKK